MPVEIRKRGVNVDIEGVTELYINELKNHYENKLRETETKTGDPDIFSNLFLLGMTMSHEIIQLKEQVKKLENQSINTDGGAVVRIDGMISKIQAVFNK